MLVDYSWITCKTGEWRLHNGLNEKRERKWRGLFLFGIIPLYIKNYATDYYK